MVPGANPWRVIGQIRFKLRIAAAAVHVPIGVEDQFRGVVDLMHWKAVYNEGEKGVNVVEKDEIPPELLDFAKAKRAEFIEPLAEVNDGMVELFFNDQEPTLEQLVSIICHATIENTSIQPVKKREVAFVSKDVPYEKDGVFYKVG
ncbi:hypothetical protein JAAARDRAFT_193500 [Jaapia argillacea MUCL 33604]|uniref:Uncharacterized protein n=1 Tax=Jaapia argillacea MUCL 33604 TaxID=933084 RepID=A0A067Q3G5_9AGAM|nr:hypothetical protein JAAARDRAFT_193500 [Jaapia argillacea MUCL 33604]